MPGPVPKRSEERLGHANRAGQAGEKSRPTPNASPVVNWPEPDEEWHPIARRWFASLGKSGQAVYYQPSDVERARYVAHAMSLSAKQQKFSAVLFAAVNSAAGELLDTEGSRRRLRIELERAAEPDAEYLAAVASVDSRRRRPRSVS